MMNRPRISIPTASLNDSRPNRASGNKAAGLAVLAVAVGLCSESFAQSSQPALEEILVTATRRQASLQEVPSSIAAIGGADLERQGITDFRNVSESVSGVTLDFPNRANNAAIYIRGVGTSGAGTVQSVSTMVDGVYQAQQGLAFTELMDIERIEILRGPQGTLFGKNSTAGAIRIFTADPDTEEFSGKLQGVAGNYDNTELRGLVNIPLIEGKLAMRISGYTAERDGYTRNVLLGQDTRGFDRDGWRAKLLWNVTDAFQVKLTADNHDQTSIIDEGITQYGSGALANAALHGFTLPPVTLGKYQQDVSGESSERVERYILNLDWNFLGHSLSTISSWEDNKRYHRQDRDETAALGDVVRVNPFIVATTTENTGLSEIETHEVQLSSDREGALSYLLGYYYQSIDSISITTIDPIFSGRTPIITDSSAYFGNGTYAFNDRWSVNVGVRYDEDERTGSNAVLGNNHVETFRETTYSAKVVYQPTPDRMFYFTHDKGFKSGGVNREFSTCGQGLCLGADQATWDPETAFNYEVGMKTEWLNNRLRVNAALFYTIFEDFQVTQYVSEAVSLVVSNAAEVESKGIEVDFTGVVNDHLTVNGSVTYVQSEYSDYSGAPCPELEPAGCVNGTQDLSGETLDHAPRLSFNLGAEYRNSFASMAGLEWFARADLIYKGKQNLYVLLPKATEESAYALLNGRIGLESYDSWRLTLWGKNITNERYRSAALSSGLGGLSEVPGLPRTYGLTVDWYF